MFIKITGLAFFYSIKCTTGNYMKSQLYLDDKYPKI